MAGKRVARRLAAILNADVRGYSRLMGEDEVATIETLKAHRKVISDLIGEYGGRLVDFPGDNLLAEFPSVVDAVECAAAIQKELAAINGRLPEKSRMEFRIGVNLGDVIEDEGSIYGEGVNIAARIQAMAEGGGICIAGSVYDQVKNKLTFGFENLGFHSVKNIGEPVLVYRVAMAAGARSAEKSKSISADLPSIAVLPFTNMSGDPAQEYFSDGITEDLITDLSKISALFVIARNSVFTYKGKAVKVEDVGKELGVRYVLEGSVRKAENRVRITAQLVDAATGGHIWAERYDREFRDIFALQDEVTQEIVSVLTLKLTEQERRQLTRSRMPSNLEAYDYYLRGLDYFYRYSKSSNEQAREMFEKAVDLDPQYALAWCVLGFTHLLEWSLGWGADSTCIDRADDFAQKALALDDSLPDTHDLLGSIHLWRKQHDKAVSEHRIAVSLDPNNAEWLAGLGGVLLWAGRPEEAIDVILKAMKLNPVHPPYYLWSLGHAYLLIGKYDQAIASFKRVLIRNPEFWPSHVLLAAALSETGRYEEARIEAGEILRLNPHFTLESWRVKCPFKDQERLEQRFLSLREAGLK
ncbi:MAG: adenylate/guanylate cyclase domain-containing protein [Desulfobacteraceae bacterium]|nr:MAG: adenylate/guanylate cyclase domain-containing protein [Desulfobacteraceae bacterium]